MFLVYVHYMMLVELYFLLLIEHLFSLGALGVNLHIKVTLMSNRDRSYCLLNHLKDHIIFDYLSAFNFQFGVLTYY